MTFELHPNLLSKHFIADLPLCKVFLEDESLYPWLLLVPRRSGVLRIMDLNSEDQLQLLKELDLTQNVLWKSYSLTQLNVAAIGNKTPQLHVHVIGRSNTDPAWPNTVWDHSVRLPYTEEQRERIIHCLRSTFVNS
jgi:diadenosine tetraphosphate (Ap4A) HIT family hydrolase